MKSLATTSWIFVTVLFAAACGDNGTLANFDAGAADAPSSIDAAAVSIDAAAHPDATPAVPDAHTIDATPPGPDADLCGNGVVNAGEQCDDGNQIDTDDCSNLCVANVTGTWNQQSPATSPPARAGAAIAFDSFSGSTILFGGQTTTSGQTTLADTWSWDGTNWTQLSPTMSPSGVAAAVMAYDEQHQQIVLYGGLSHTGSGNTDTWLWDGTTWSMATTNTAPPARFGQAMAYDSDRGVVVLYGGIGAGNFSALDDTWEWDGSSWTEISASASNTTTLRMTYDKIHKQMVAVNTFDAATWLYDGTQWTQAGTAPFGGSQLFFQSVVMAYDDLIQRVVAYDTNGDTWEWDGLMWNAQSPTNASNTTPPPRRSGAATYDSVQQAVVVFGGFDAVDSANVFNDTWQYDRAPATNVSVTSLSPSSGMSVGGDTITITGSGFSIATQVVFGSTSVQFQINSDTSLSVIDPFDPNGGGDSVNVCVETEQSACGSSSSASFAYLASSPAVLTGGFVNVDAGDGAHGPMRVSASPNVIAWLGGDENLYAAYELVTAPTNAMSLTTATALGGFNLTSDDTGVDTAAWGDPNFFGFVCTATATTYNAAQCTNAVQLGTL